MWVKYRSNFHQGRSSITYLVLTYILNPSVTHWCTVTIQWQWASVHNTQEEEIINLPWLTENFAKTSVNSLLQSLLCKKKMVFSNDKRANPSSIKPTNNISKKHFFCSSLKMWLKLYFCVRVNSRTLVQDLLHWIHEFSNTWVPCVAWQKPECRQNKKTCISHRAEHVLKQFIHILVV